MTAGLASSKLILHGEPLFRIKLCGGYYTFKDLFKVGMILIIIGAIVIALGMLLAGMPMGTPLH